MNKDKETVSDRNSTFMCTVPLWQRISPISKFFDCGIDLYMAQVFSVDNQTVNGCLWLKFTIDKNPHFFLAPFVVHYFIVLYTASRKNG